MRIFFKTMLLRKGLFSSKSYISWLSFMRRSVAATSVCTKAYVEDKIF